MGEDGIHLTKWGKSIFTNRLTRLVKRGLNWVQLLWDGDNRWQLSKRMEVEVVNPCDRVMGMRKHLKPLGSTT